ncbi:hypothetical protein PYCCODRAFT_1404822 [Trametes coccinea BRFM310]|uniref:Uncharacterized protein n=1 Tax=Trametes coccinea (strain BRFM310) TaxID=1353009 RepID=A0A1Y2J0H7_TRAC3|nr:hypothetical protein PYCCODRAFT_1404822 [Trametes coccinea BRFM310]
MHLTFTPALGEQTVLKVAPVGSGRPASQSVLFKATFEDRESYLNAQADGVKVEVWSNIPVAGRSFGEWGAFEFGELRYETVPEGIPTFSVGDAVEKPEDVQESSLYVHVRAPFHEHIDGRFSFTYRLVYPSGEIRWLGEFGRNGELVIERGLPGVDLREGWNISDDGTYRTHAFPGERVLGYLTDPNAWTYWSWKSSGLPTFTRATEPSEGLAMVLSPRPYAREVNVLRPLVFVASDLTSLRISEQGKIVLHSSSPFARVSFSVLEHARELLDNVAALCDGQVAAFDDVSAIIACRVPDAELPAHLIVLPMADNLDGRSAVPLRLSALPEAMSGWDSVVLAPPDLQTAKLVAGRSSKEDQLAFIGASGAHVVIAPVQEVTADSHVLRYAFLTPHQKLVAKVERSVAQALPTPPPSPPPSSAPSRIAADTLPASSSDALAEATPLSRSHSPGQGGRATRARRPRSSALIPYNSPHLIRRYLHMILNVVFWFWSVFARAISVRLIGENNTRRISGLIGLALMKTASPAVPKVCRGDAARTDRDEPAAQCGAVDDTPLERPTAEDDQGHATTSSFKQPAPYPAQVLSDQASTHIVINALTFVSCDAEAPLLYLQSDTRIEVDEAILHGCGIPPPSTTKLDDGAQLLRFGAEYSGGELEVTLKI